MLGPNRDVALSNVKNNAIVTKTSRQEKKTIKHHNARNQLKTCCNSN